MLDTTGLPAPVAARLRRPGWRDPRLLMGVALVAGSVLAGSWVVRTAQHTVPVYAARSAVVPGDGVQASSLQVVEVRGVDLEHYLSADEPLPDDAVALRTVAAGELVPRTAIGSAQELQVRPVALPLRGSASDSLTPGALVDVWFTPPQEADEKDGGTPRALVEAVTVAEVDAETGSFGADGGTVHVLVPNTVLADVLRALASDGTVDVVPVPGSGG